MKYDQDLVEIFKIYGNSTPRLEEEINIFKILNLEYDEVRLHSRILKFFIEKDPYFFINVAIPNKIWNIENDLGKFIDVKLEVPIQSSEELLSDGRIDLLLKFEKQAFIIENKIFARDGNNQLIKYFKYAESVYGSNNFKILYLTPKGNLPDKKATSEVDYFNLEINNDFFTISYKKNISNWLSEFENYQENTRLKILINQYLNTIKTICGIMTEDEKNRITNLLSVLANNQINEQDNLFAKLFAIKSDIETIENKIHEFWMKFSEHISKNFSVHFKPGSIMIRIISEERGVCNLYLEYNKSSTKKPYLSFWFNKKYRELFQSIFNQKNILIDSDGYFRYKTLDELFTGDDFQKYLNSDEKAIEQLYSKIFNEIMNYLNQDDIQDLIKTIKSQLTVN
jgi:hypothetical protein